MDMEQVGRKKRRRFYGAGSKEELINKIKVLYNEGYSQHEIANMIDIPRGTISRWMMQYGIKGRDPGEEGKKKSKIYDYDEDFFVKIDHPDKAYIIGFIMGDGFIVDDGKRKRLGITIAKEDEQILRDIAKFMGVEELIKIRKPTYSNEQEKVSLIINCTKMCNDLISLGVEPHKTKNEKWIDFNSDELNWSFLRGLFDADGSIRVYERNGYKKVSFRITNSLDMLIGVRDFLRSQGLPIKNGISKKIGCYEFSISSIKTAKTIFNKLYSNGFIKLERKYNTFALL